MSVGEWGPPSPVAPPIPTCECFTDQRSFSDSRVFAAFQYPSFARSTAIFAISCSHVRPPSVRCPPTFFVPLYHLRIASRTFGERLRSGRDHVPRLPALHLLIVHFPSTEQSFLTLQQFCLRSWSPPAISYLPSILLFFFPL